MSRRLSGCSLKRGKTTDLTVHDGFSTRNALIPPSNNNSFNTNSSSSQNLRNSYQAAKNAGDSVCATRESLESATSAPGNLENNSVESDGGNFATPVDGGDIQINIVDGSPRRSNAVTMGTPVVNRS